MSRNLNRLQHLYEYEQLAAVNRWKDAGTHLRPRLQRIVDAAGNHFGLPIAALTLIANDEQVVLVSNLDEQDLDPMMLALSGLAVVQDRPILINDTLAKGALKERRSHREQTSNIRSFYGLPIHSPYGEAVATLAIADEKPNRLDEASLRTLRDMASWAEAEWEREWLTRFVEHEHALADGLSMITQTIADAVLVFDRSGRVVHANVHAEKLLGADGRLEAGSDLLTALRSKVARGMLLRLLNRGPLSNPETIEFKLENNNRRDTQVRVTISSTDDGDWFVAIAHDISSQIAHQRKLEWLLRRFETILDSAGDAIVRVDTHGLVEYANPAMAELLGVSREQLVGTDLHTHYHAKKTDGTPYPWQACPTTRTMLEGVAQPRAEEVFWRRDGRAVNVEYAVNPVVEAESGEVTGAVMIMRDIEARIRLENLKKAFIANVSHELRTPLTAIKGALALLLGGAMGDLPQEQQHMLNVAHTSTDRLVRLVDDLLDLGRLDANRLTLHPRLCSVAELSRLALNDVAGAAQASGIQLIEQLSESVAHLGLEVDPDRIVQILVNLLGNAVRFSATGQRVVLTADATESGIRFSVRDFGPGIQDSERAVIFERFMQSNSPDQRIIGGTGLGLAIASELARAHQGHLELGDVKVGSIFHLHLPHPEARAEVA